MQRFVFMQHRILFTGHMIDRPDRAEPRFPADKEAAAQAAIRKALQDTIARADGPCMGIAGGASGGDIIFLEQCRELGIPTKIYLALPVDAFIEASVAPAGAGWVERLKRLLETMPASVLGDERRNDTDDSLWTQTNLLMLEEALKAGSDHATLIAMWNGKDGDGPGGTGHLLTVARQRGLRTEIIDTGML